jgi:hypothetical protein
MAKKLPISAEIVRGRICWLCEHIYLSPGECGYSEYTPGSDMVLECGKQYWDFDTTGDGLAELKSKLMSAERCRDFTQRA